MNTDGGFHLSYSEPIDCISRITQTGAYSSVLRDATQESVQANSPEAYGRYPVIRSVGPLVPGFDGWSAESPVCLYPAGRIYEVPVSGW